MRDEIRVLRMRDEVLEKKKPTTLKGEIISWSVTILGTLAAVLLINTFVFRTVEVQGNSMFPTLSDGDRIIVWQLFYNPGFQDIIVLEHTNGVFHVKRILGVAGDHVDYIDGELFVNDTLISEPYILDEQSNVGFLFSDLCQLSAGRHVCDEIPNGYFLVLGDNRNNSGDSREYGLIHESQIMGRATLRFLPFSDFGLVN